MNKLVNFMVLFTCMVTYAQQVEFDLETFAERLFQVQNQDLAYEDLYESLLLFYTNKIDLNSTSIEELQSLYILSPKQIASFFTYRDQYGPLLSINELQIIPYFDISTIKNLQPFISIRSKESLDGKLVKRILQEENNYFLFRYETRLQDQLGYSKALPLDTTFLRDTEGTIQDTLTDSPTRYRGTQSKLYGRFRTSKPGDFSLGLTFEKDAGERFEFTKQQKGFDFYSYHLLLENKIGFKKIMLGDFQLQTGQGLVFGAGFNPGKGAETVNTIKRNTIGFRPYTSVLESGFFRGLGLTKRFQNFELSAFISHDKKDGNILNDTTVSDFSEFVSSIQQTGLHRTPQEHSRKDQIAEQNFGAVLQYQPKRYFKVGINYLHTQFSLPIQRRANNYNQFEFSGNANSIYSIFSSCSWQNFHFFGEYAQSASNGIGGIGGFLASLTPQIDMAFSLRKYQEDFHSFYANSLSEGNRSINENGAYWGISIKPTNKHKISAYYDQFTFPWLRFGTESPSNGYEWLGRYTYRPFKKVNLFIQAREQLRQVTIPNGNLNLLTEQKRKNYIFGIIYNTTQHFTLKTRVQSSNQTEGTSKTKGIAVVQDVNFTLWKLIFHTRTALFETDDFDNAQYIYENDVLYSFAIPAYSGIGIRNYIMMRLNASSNFSVWLRYAQTSFNDRRTTGNGLEMAEGSISSELKLMVRKKF